MAAIPTHRWVAEKTGHSISAISRFRRGGRPPTFDAMARFETAFGWPVCDQVTHKTRGDWSTELNEILATAVTNEEGE